MLRNNVKEEVDNLKWENAAVKVKEVYDSLYYKTQHQYKSV